MKNLLLTIAFCLALLHTACATTHIIRFSYPAYSPSGFNVSVGDTVIWKGDFERFPLSSVSLPEGVAEFYRKDGSEFMYVVKQAGTYRYQCDTYKNDKMTGYFVATVNNKTEVRDDEAMVYINAMGHSFHLVTPDAIPHSVYTITVTRSSGQVVYKGEIKADEKDKWIATEAYLTGSYELVVTDGKHTFGRRFTK
jgi:plastocyanin